MHPPSSTVAIILLSLPLLFLALASPPHRVARKPADSRHIALRQDEPSTGAADANVAEDEGAQGPAPNFFVYVYDEYWDAFEYDDESLENDFVSLPMVLNGEVSDHYKTCNPAAFGEKDPQKRLTACLEEDEYDDGVAIMYESEKKVDVAVGTVPGLEGAAVPVIASHEFDVDINEGILVLMYGCSAVAEAVDSLIQFKINHPMKTFVLQWIKKCRGGVPNDRIVVTSTSAANEYEQVAQLKVSETDGHTYLSKDVSAASPSTTFYFMVQGGIQHFSPPKVQSGNSDLVSTDVRGDFYAEVLTEQNVAFHVLYNCSNEKDGKAIVNMSLEVPPWNPIRIEWVKFCAKSLNGMGSIDIGTKVDGDNVVSQGVVASGYAIGQDVTPELIVSAAEDKVQFFFNNRDGADSSAVSFHRFLFSAAQPSIVSAFVRKTGLASSFKASGGDFPPGSSKNLPVGLVCKRKGQTKITVTAVTVSHGNLEFSFSKICASPRKHEESGFLITAGSIIATGAAVGVCILVGLVFVWHRSRKSRIVYSPAPTADGGTTA